jgi:quaternary ammonium compound-resistance protein SugE
MYLFVAGLLETGWTIGMKFSEGFTRPVPTVFTVIAIVASMWLLARATQTLPIGTAYAVWVGIGAAGTALLGAWIFREALSPARLFFLVLLVVSILGLKFTARS